MGIFFLIVFAHYLGLLNFIENKILNLFSWPLKKITFQQTKNLPSTCITSTMDALPLDQLTAKNKILEQENLELRNQLNFKNKNQYHIITAQIIAKNLDATDQVIILDRGASDGVKKDQPVLFGDGILIGKIIKTQENISFARVLSDNQSKIAATILNSDHSLGVVEGGFGLSIKMTFIPRNENIITGDQVITSGLELAIPRGLIIGKVAAIENESYQPFQQAVITPAVDYEKISNVGILANP